MNLTCELKVFHYKEIPLLTVSQSMQIIDFMTMIDDIIIDNIDH